MAMNPKAKPTPTFPLPPEIIVEQQNKGGRPSKGPVGEGWDVGPEGEVKPASSSLYLPLLPTCLPKEQSKSRDQQHNHNSLYDAWQGVSTDLSM